MDISLVIGALLKIYTLDTALTGRYVVAKVIE